MATNLGTCVKRERKRKKFTQPTLAVKAKIGLTTLRDIEQGVTLDPQLSIIGRIADVLKVSVDHLLGGGKEGPPRGLQARRLSVSQQRAYALPSRAGRADAAASHPSSRQGTRSGLHASAAWRAPPPHAPP